MGLDAFVDAREGALGEEAPVRVVLGVEVEGHVVEPGGGVRVRVGVGPAVVRPVAHAGELIGRVVVDIRGDDLAEVVRPVAVPVVVERVGDVVAVVDRDPQDVGPGDEGQPLGIAQAAREEPPAAAVGVVLVDRAAHRIAHRVARRGVAHRGDRDVELVVGTDGDVLELVAVGPAELRAARVREVRDDHLPPLGEGVAGGVDVAVDLVRLRDVEVGRRAVLVEDDVVRVAQTRDEVRDERVAPAFGRTRMTRPEPGCETSRSPFGATAMKRAPPMRA